MTGSWIEPGVPLSPPQRDPVLRGPSLPPTSCLPCREFPRVRAPLPGRRSSEGRPSSYSTALPASPAQGRQRGSILCETNIFSGAAPASHTILFSSPTNPLIEDKAPVNPHLIKAATKLAETCPRLRCTKQQESGDSHGEMLSLCRPQAGRDAGGDSTFLLVQRAGKAVPWVI